MDPAVDRLSHADVSRRDVVVRLGAGGLASLLLAASKSSAAVAQDASPAASPVAVGITTQLMGSGQPAAAPGMELALRRVTIASGGYLPAHSHPGAHIIVVEAGTWGYTALVDTAQLTRAVAEGTPAPAETLPNGTEVILNPGDWIFVEEPQDDIRNAGEDDVVLFVATLTPIGEPFTTFL